MRQRWIVSYLQNVFYDSGESDVVMARVDHFVLSRANFRVIINIVFQLIFLTVTHVECREHIHQVRLIFFRKRSKHQLVSKRLQSR